MNRIIGFGAVAIFFFTILFSAALAQGQFLLSQTSASNGGASSGGIYTLRDAAGEVANGLASGEIYQVNVGMALGSSGGPPSPATSTPTPTVLVPPTATPTHQLYLPLVTH